MLEYNILQGRGSMPKRVTGNCVRCAAYLLFYVKHAPSSSLPSTANFSGPLQHKTCQLVSSWQGVHCLFSMWNMPDALYDTQLPILVVLRATKNKLVSLSGLCNTCSLTTFETESSVIYCMPKLVVLHSTKHVSSWEGAHCLLSTWNMLMLYSILNCQFY
jgi:hypothetical protein